MPTRQLQNYLKMYRKRSGLTQAELGYLLGCKGSGKVSRYECFRRMPTLETALAYSVIFRIPVPELFAGVFQKVERKVMRRVGLLARKLQTAQDDPHSAQKLETLAVSVREAGPVFDPEK